MCVFKRNISIQNKGKSKQIIGYSLTEFKMLNLRIGLLAAVFDGKKKHLNNNSMA